MNTKELEEDNEGNCSEPQNVFLLQEHFYNNFDR